MKMMTATLFSGLFAASVAFGAQPVYTCTGGTGDVTIVVDRQGVIEVANSECSVRLVFSRAGRSYSAFRGVPGNDSDTELCGESATVSSAIFQLAPRVEMVLHGGESEGRYDCRLGR